jgi:hypothetical protein
MVVSLLSKPVNGEAYLLQMSMLVLDRVRRIRKMRRLITTLLGALLGQPRPVPVRVPVYTSPRRPR